MNELNQKKSALNEMRKMTKNQLMESFDTGFNPAAGHARHDALLGLSGRGCNDASLGFRLKAGMTRTLFGVIFVVLFNTAL